LLSNDFEFVNYISYTKRTDQKFIRFHVTENYKKELEMLNKSTCQELYISGLSQKALEYFVLNYAHRFPVIGFVACTTINDLSSLNTLDTLEYLLIEHNTRLTKLWNMDMNTALRGIYLEDTKKLTGFDDLISSPVLKELAINESVNSSLSSNKWTISSLTPLLNVFALERLSISVSEIKDDGISILKKMTGLKRLNLNTGLFELEDFALLNARLKNTVVSPDRPFYVYDGDEFAHIVGRGRPLKRNNPKLAEIQDRWNLIVSQNKDS